MTEPQKKHAEDDIHDNPPGDTPAFDVPPHEEPELDPIAALEAEKAAALTEASAFKDRALRVMAEMENLRKRTEREVSDAKAYAVTGFARDLLNVADTFSRAFQSLPEAERPADGPVKAFLDGIELTERELLKTLEKHGVKRIAADGQKFDPNLHQAMFEAPNAELPNGTVIQTIQDGYVIGERVLRPAMVGVSKGGPKAAPKPTGPAA